jgi:uncharacterized protein
MLCPVCKTTNLMIADRSGVEIDYCPNCRGVWLDRGELDKIIERMAQPAPQQPAAAPPPPPNVPPQYGNPAIPANQQNYGNQPMYRRKDDDSVDEDEMDFRRRHPNQPYPQSGYKSKSKSWLKDMFDF